MQRSCAIRSVALLLTILMLLGLLPMTALAANDGATAQSGDIFDELRGKFYSMAVGGTYDPTDPALKEILTSINDTAQDYWNRMNKNPVSNAVKGSYRDANDKLIEGLDASQDYIWAEYPLGRRRPSSTVYINANSIHFTFQYLRAMALAYETKGCALYHNQDMLKDIKAAIEFVYQNHFNPANSRYGNWFSWQIGGPVYLGEALMLLYDEFTQDEITKYATALIHFLDKTTMTGANATWTERVRMYAGILLKDESWLDFVSSRLPGMLSYTTSKDGYYVDGTFVQHDKITYNGGYGLMCLTDSAYLVYMLAGTKWAVPKEKSDLIYRWVYENYVPIVANGLTMDAFRGREITRYDTTQPRGTLIIANAMLMLAETAPAETAADFKGYIKSWFSSQLMVDEMNHGADTPWYKFPLDTVVKVQNILKDSSIQPKDLKEQMVQMVSGARTVQFREKYASVLSMTSQTIANCEIGDSNAKGWYTGNGMLNLYTDDLERSEGVAKATIDWYRLPGATAVYGKSQASGRFNLNSFTGGVTDGEYGVSGMDLSVQANSLKAKKSYFFFDDEIVALGSGISGQGQIETTLENYMLQSGNRSYAVNGAAQQMSMDGKTVSYEGVSTLHMDGNVSGSGIGFYFPNGADIQTVSGTRTGKWTDLGEYNTDPAVQSADWFTAWLSHGTNPSNSSYSYVLLPTATTAQTEKYAKSSDIEILQQDEKAHAVYEKSMGVLGVNFWKAGSIDAYGVQNYLRTDAPATVMVRENDETLELYVADSTRKSAELNIMINRAGNYVISADEGIEVVSTEPYLKLRINTKNSAGKTYAIKLSFDGTPVLGQTEIKSAVMDNDALVVTLAPVTGAKEYEVTLAVDGTVVKTLTTAQTQLPIYGLTPGTTYEITAYAKDGSAKGPASESKTVTIPDVAAFYDEYEDFSKMYSRSDSWGFDAGNAQNFLNQDTTRIKLLTKTKEEFVYYLPELLSFKLETYGYNVSNTKSYGTIKLYTSADGKTWTAQTYDAAPFTDTAGGWFRTELTAKDGIINAGANYLKVEVESHPIKVWAPQFTRFDATMRKSSSVKTMIDPIANDEKTWLTSNVVYQANSDAAKFGGDENIALPKNGETAELIWSWTNLRDLNAEAFVKAGGSVEFVYSADGKTWTALSCTETKGAADAEGYQAIRLQGQLPNGTNYVKATIRGDAALGSVAMNYLPENMTAQAVRFADSSLDGVIHYDASPVIKTAPMNATSELTYSSADPDIAKYTQGTLSFYQTGSTTVRVAVAGTSIQAELPVRVYKNAAYQMPTSASSVNTLYTTVKAVDGDMTVSRWQSNTNGKEWFQIDLGKATTFDVVDIQWYSNGADYQILTSDDGTTWDVLQNVTGAASGGYVRFDLPQAKTARYLKMQGITEHEYSFFEFRALQAEAAPEQPTVNLALGKKATASANDPNNKSLTPEKAVDGDENTRWASGRDDDQWYIVDLEEHCTITGFGILWEGAHGKEYKIQVSENGTDWTDVIHETNGSAGWKNYTLSSPAAGRYVRMLGIKRGNARYGYSMYEFQVFGYQPHNPKPVTSIRLSQNTLSLLEGWSCALTATTEPSSNAYSLKWTSSDPTIVKVDNNGLVTAIGSSGTATITVESVLDPTVKDTCEVTITPYAGRPTKVSDVKIVNEPTGLLKKGQDWSLAANVLPAGASNRNVNWSSSDPTVAAIDANGVVHAVSAGRAVIRAASVSAPAIFAEITVEIGHTVRFESAETVQIEEQLVADGAYAVKPEEPSRAGYRFAGWYRDPDASEAFDFTQPIHADTVIYLKWTRLPQDVLTVPATNPSMDLGLILGIINGGSGMSFSDVTSSDWFFEDVAAAYQLGLMNGVSAYEFAPKAPLSRAMVAAMLYRMAGSPAAYYGGRQFTDVADGKWYSSAIRWASQMGIVTGFQNGSFRPNENVTRVQLAAMLFRFAQYQSRDIQGRGDLNAYQDGSSVQSWAKEAMQWAVAKGLISGKSGARLDPSGSATRAEAAAVLVRFLRQP